MVRRQAPAASGAGHDRPLARHCAVPDRRDRWQSTTPHSGSDARPYRFVKTPPQPLTASARSGQLEVTVEVMEGRRVRRTDP